MKIASVIGARPQFIKCAPLTKELRKNHQDLLIHTGQHYDYNMNKVFFDELGIPPPEYNLGIGSGSHGYQTGEMLKRIGEILDQVKPDLVIVYGDTNSTLAGALAAAKLHIKIAHVESGLRSFDKSMPEEINRVLTDHCSDWLFCPTRTAVSNLKNEGIITGVYFTGDVMLDALNSVKVIAERSKILGDLGLITKSYLLVTIHRASNTDNPDNLGSISRALIQLGGLGKRIVFPVHPRTAKSLKSCGLYDDLKEKVIVIEPLGYLDFLKLLNHSSMVLTDSGGIQKEAYMLRVPCVTLRENTEWVETVEDGWNVLAGVDPARIVRLAEAFKPSNEQRDVFGKEACKAIAGLIGAKN
jgi:UDP-N-acetylglucosamine 2-epimerase